MRCLRSTGVAGCGGILLSSSSHFQYSLAYCETCSGDDFSEKRGGGRPSEEDAFAEECCSRRSGFIAEVGCGDEGRHSGHPRSFCAQASSLRRVQDGGERWPHDLCRWTQESVCVQEWVQRRPREDAGIAQHPRAMRPIGDVSWTSRTGTAPDLGEILASLVSGFVPRGRMDVVGHQRGGAAWGSWGAPHTKMRYEHREALQARTGGVRDGVCLWAHREYDAGGRSGDGGTYGSHEGGDGRQGGWFGATTCRAQGQVRGLLAHCGHQWARRRARRSSRVLSIQQPPSPVPEWDVDRGRSCSPGLGLYPQHGRLSAGLRRRRSPSPSPGSSSAQSIP